ncbi:hypothetical protein [Hymenobacter arizonensis]|uniref:Uncharacterized protein n=1 Tax=Hymenobacter arizonensis TaxID=1227077 RepID=A0A1I6BRA5_HYMAR|nr:hypothetical protein [Hymenobacter arizonensis]SFQ83397.1 hypothetical protein SAMN04515668_4959 [Hymenobacter arizonensis]
MNLRPLLTLTIAPLFLLGCDYYDGRLKIVNKTPQVLAAEVCPDTLPRSSCFNHPAFYQQARIRPDSTYSPLMPEANGWEKAIFRSQNNQLNLFVFRLDSLDKYQSIDTLIARKMYRRLSRSKQQLINDNWRITIQ